LKQLPEIQLLFSSTKDFEMDVFHRNLESLQKEYLQSVQHSKTEYNNHVSNMVTSAQKPFTNQFDQTLLKKPVMCNMHYLLKINNQVSAQEQNIQDKLTEYNVTHQLARITSVSNLIDRCNDIIAIDYKQRHTTPEWRTTVQDIQRLHQLHVSLDEPSTDTEKRNMIKSYIDTF
jgi:hypothetical protein